MSNSIESKTGPAKPQEQRNNGKTRIAAKQGIAMKDTLQSLFEDNRNKYPDFLKRTKQESTSTQWGTGVMPAYDLLPYNAELLGHKAGRMLKKESEPGNNKQCYHLEKHGEIISETEYAEYNSREGYWLVYQRFFIYQPDHAIEFAFGSSRDSDTEANLNFVKWAKLENSTTTNSYLFNRRGEYTELDYNYQNNKITTINQRSWLTDEIIAHRLYQLNHASNGVIITEILPDGSIHKIFPKK
ncbi:hypothetical protein [Pseudomonas sp. Fl4BN1]|uniref:hypothetical protein n=1 Tax=Pseudomonas sp. Fl4BN1 TaxID=2697651 RepID=UPI00137889AC|nr:hypothetical protein [Pseudomonas sp. Fl4BN1]NBF08382.1 hypothetical protein [Pseudomonas sp. Fl4BN1]